MEDTAGESTAALATGPNVRPDLHINVSRGGGGRNPLDTVAMRAYRCGVEKRVATVRINDGGMISIEVDISPDADPEDLVTTQKDDEAPDGDALGQIRGARPPRWVELAGG